ncbi:arylformamidase [Heyndrickxia oleronia]|uniref:Kynurenine formamidase n=1 Tax=Heyndrickxia oleronia TaxID=38875 RepID=A0AAW6SUY6_9BACI|nr:arylformamidase [Heyndrickxia oleronia]MDH5162626.1 arylformamidase [Heyndrickxia oleronia]
MTIIDISQPLTNSIAVWPGDTPFSYEVAVTKEESGSVNIGKVTMSTHTGTHIDSPFHFDNKGKKIKDLDLSIYVGPALVIDVSNYHCIGAEELQSYNLNNFTRILLKTHTTNRADIFPTSIPYLHPNIGPFLQKRGIQLIGVDVPSVDPLDSKELEAHHALFENGVHILENIVLEDVEPGGYELIAVPLSIQEADGSPVRAILRSL